MSSDLGSRILPAIIYVISIVACTIWSSGPAIILMQIFFILCLYEFVFQNSKPRLDGLSLMINIAIAGLLINFVIQESIWAGLLAFVGILFISNGVRLISSAQSIFNQGSVLLRSVAYITIPFAGTSYNLLHRSDYHLTLLGVFILLWLNDAGAYFVGRAIGKNKILLKVSPGKSWEGWIGGAIIGLASCFVLHHFMGHLSISNWLVIGVLVAIFGLIGDLVESSWKRSLSLKDSGKLLGGHGGFLDRLDSFIYSIPIVNSFLLFI